jgi:hypothetical protein
MAMDEDGSGWWPWAVLPRVAAAAVSVPVVVGFVTLGATVIVARSVRDLARQTWARLPRLRNGGRPPASGGPR